MIVKRKWLATENGGVREWPVEGWYLFGFIPLYIRDMGPRYRKSIVFRRDK
jgi:hypothetical protein